MSEKEEIALPETELNRRIQDWKNADAENKYQNPLRDEFAGRALQGFAADSAMADVTPKRIAELAYIWADAMLAERKKQGNRYQMWGAVVSALKNALQSLEYVHRTHPEFSGSLKRVKDIQEAQEVLAKIKE